MRSSPSDSFFKGYWTRFEESSSFCPKTDILSIGFDEKRKKKFGMSQKPS
jgi:hypothetical protein